MQHLLHSRPIHTVGMADEERAARLRKARKDARYEDATRAAKAFGWPVSTYLSHENASRGITVDNGRKYARAFRARFQWLYFNEGASHSGATTQEVEVVGFVQAGVWAETNEWAPDEQYSVTVKCSLAFPDAALTGLEVRGSSMNKVYKEGTVLICISAIEQRVEPVSGQNVIVQRRDKYGLMEATVKELEIRADGQRFLWPRSDDPDYTVPLKWQETGADNDILVSGIVIQSIRPE